MIEKYKPTAKAKKLMNSAILTYNTQKPEELILVLEKIKRDDKKSSSYFLDPKPHLVYGRYKE